MPKSLEGGPGQHSEMSDESLSTQLDELVTEQKRQVEIVLSEKEKMSDKEKIKGMLKQLLEFMSVQLAELEKERTSQVEIVRAGTRIEEIQNLIDRLDSIL